MRDIRSRRFLGTMSGLAAILLWSTNAALTRSLSENLGPVTTAASAYGIAGIVMAAWLAARREERRRLRRLPKPYMWWCGGLFVVYTLAYFLAIGLCRTRAQMLEVNIINFLWPSLTLLFAVPLLRKRARPMVMAGVGVAFCGMALACLAGSGFTWGGLVANFRANPLPYLLGCVCAVTWALYGVLCNKYGSDVPGLGGMPLFVLAAAAACNGLRILVAETPVWTPSVVWELLYTALLPTLAAYVLWDVAMRRGNIVIVAVASYTIPLLSTAVASMYLGIPLSPAVWAACALIGAGAALSKISISEQPVKAVAHGTVD